MKSRSSIEIRRCRPLLGTYVEITASLPERGLSSPKQRKVPPLSALQDAVNAAFSALERIQTLMSVYDPASELSLVNREAAKRPVTVSRELFTVLRRADQLARESGGAFDYTVAPTLARWGLRPAWLKRRRAGNWRHVSLLTNRRVRFSRPLALDLGGIAKGYAVDMAISVLRRHGVHSAIVNAGGDLRVFGRRSVAVHLRHPSVPRLLAGRLEISDDALATSSPCFTERQQRGLTVSHLVNSRERSAATGRISVSVRAQECWLADALTKVVLNGPAAAAQTLLARHRAQAIVLSGATERGCGGWRGPTAADAK